MRYKCEKNDIMFEHEHPLNFIDLWSKQLKHEEEDEESEEETEDLIANQDFRCLCFRCDEEINWFHRYYYTCGQCNYSIHKFCAELPERLEGICDVEHTLYFFRKWISSVWKCDRCKMSHKAEVPGYRCLQCYFYFDAKCASKRLQKNIIYHPSHKHPLVCIPKQLLYECDACGKEHKGIFYQCPMYPNSFIHSHCAFLPKKLHIQHTTNDIFSHIHPLTLAYSFPLAKQESKFLPRCRVCLDRFSNPNLWIYKCDKCRYYSHLNCATSRNEPFMSILTSPGKTIKNYKDVEHPDLLHLPFPDPSYSILKHLFFKKNGPCTLEVPNDVTKTHDNISHQHSLVSSRIKSTSFHDPMKRIELLCNGCLRPITTTPIYM
ncbi:hypothetical protein L1987_87208 [Smallanthus sonchifolius]|nr:hypothetical protein L1987_87208 [Smallanthus sonchifolius]